MIWEFSLDQNCFFSCPKKLLNQTSFHAHICISCQSDFCTVLNCATDNTQRDENNPQSQPKPFHHFQKLFINFLFITQILSYSVLSLACKKLVDLHVIHNVHRPPPPPPVGHSSATLMISFNIPHYLYSISICLSFPLFCASSPIFAAPNSTIPLP